LRELQKIFFNYPVDYDTVLSGHCFVTMLM